MPNTNGGPLASVRGFLQEIDRVDDELATLRGEYMQACQGPRQELKDIMTAAADAEIDMSSFRVLLKEHRDARAHAKRLAELDLAQRASYAEMITALGELATSPLGQAAISKANKNEARADV